MAPAFFLVLAVGAAAITALNDKIAAVPSTLAREQARRPPLPRPATRPQRSGQRSMMCSPRVLTAEGMQVINRLSALVFRISGRVLVSSIYNISGGFGLSGYFGVF